MTIQERIARFCHEVNRAYCAALGDISQLTWEDAPDWQKKSAMNGVKLHMTNPVAGPESSHVNWMAEKLADGWKYGEVKDPEKKEHPCLVPFSELPTDQQAKDYIFRAIVHQAVQLLGEEPMPNDENANKPAREEPPALSPIIKPTVGRIVYFYNKQWIGEGWDEACAAIIVHVWSDHLVNLVVFHHIATTHKFGSIHLYQPGERPENIRDIPESCWAEWMPYQVKKGFGSESGERAAGVQSIEGGPTTMDREPDHDPICDMPPPNSDPLSECGTAVASDPTPAPPEPRCDD